MRPARYQIRRWVKLARGWRCVPQSISANNRPKPNSVVIDGHEETYTQIHEAYFIKVSNKYRQVGKTLTEAQAERTRLLAQQDYKLATGEPLATPKPKGKTLEAAATEYFQNLKNRGLDPKTVNAYRGSIEPFIEQGWLEPGHKKTHIDQIEKQDLLNYMGWLRRQDETEQAQKRSLYGRRGRTYYNKTLNVAIFLKAYGKGRLLKRSEYPKFSPKKIVAHSEQELAIL